MVEDNAPTELVRPLKDMPEEAKRIVDHARIRKVQLKMMGGLAVRAHCTSLNFCDRP